MVRGQVLERSGHRRFYETYGRDLLKRDAALSDFVEEIYHDLESEQNG